MEPNRHFHQLPTNHQRVIAREIINNGNAEEVLTRALTACSVLVHTMNESGGTFVHSRHPFPTPVRHEAWPELGEATVDAGYALFSAGIPEEPIVRGCRP